MLPIMLILEHRNAENSADFSLLYSYYVPAHVFTFHFSTNLRILYPPVYTLKIFSKICHTTYVRKLSPIRICRLKWGPT